MCFSFSDPATADQPNLEDRQEIKATRARSRGCFPEAVYSDFPDKRANWMGSGDRHPRRKLLAFCQNSILHTTSTLGLRATVRPEQLNGDPGNQGGPRGPSPFKALIPCVVLLPFGGYYWAQSSKAAREKKKKKQVCS